MQELDPAIVNAMYGKKDKTPQEVAVDVAFKQVTMLAAARTAIYFEMVLLSLKRLDASAETIELMEAVNKVCSDSLQDPQAITIYQKAKLAINNDHSVNLMTTAIAYMRMQIQKEKLNTLAKEELQTSIDFTKHDDHNDMA